MSFAKEASKLLTNKYFLYFMVFLGITNVLGYLVTNQLNAVILFVIVSFLTFQFSKNMAVVIFVAIITTNLFISTKLIREGLENQTDTNVTDTSGTNTSGTDTSVTNTSGTDTSGTDAPSLQRITDTDSQIANVLPIVKNAKNNDEVTQQIKDTNTSMNNTPMNNIPMNNNVKAAISNALSDNETTDINNPGLNTSVNDPNAPEGFGGKMGNKKSAGSKEEHFGPRLDYAATIEQSYQNLDSLLGSDSIKQLSSDTQKLMQQQQNLFNTMNQMVPVLEGAQNMLKGFDLGGLTKSLSGMSSLVNAPTVV